jgi:hypothetical protein
MSLYLKPPGLMFEDIINGILIICKPLTGGDRDELKKRKMAAIDSILTK